MKTTVIKLEGIESVLSQTPGSPSSMPITPWPAHGGPLRDYVSFIDHLRAARATVEPKGEVANSDFFGINGWLISVNDVDVQVYEYAAEAAAQAQVVLILADGYSATFPDRAVHFDWVEPPHLYTVGRIIVLYVGQEPATLQLLNDALGPQFAGQLPTLRMSLFRHRGCLSKFGIPHDLHFRMSLQSVANVMAIAHVDGDQQRYDENHHHYGTLSHSGYNRALSSQPYTSPICAPRQIVRQHVEREAAVGFGKGGR
jgi:hypothetical protein